MSRLAVKLFMIVLLLALLFGCSSTGQPTAEVVEESIEPTTAAVATPTEATLDCPTAAAVETAECPTGDMAGQSVSFRGTTFTYDRTLADSVLPELVAAQPATAGPGLPWNPAEHIVFTLFGTDGTGNHAPMGQYISAQAQIHIYQTAGLNEEVRPVVAALEQLLAERPELAAYEAVQVEMGMTPISLPMLPPSNAVQSFRAQAQYITFAEGSGVRYLTQLSQGPVPVNNQELFYTFQGLAADGATYVVAYFPVALAALPATGAVGEETLAAMMGDWPAYLNATIGMLNEQPTADFRPDLALLDALINSLSVAGTMDGPALEGQ